MLVVSSKLVCTWASKVEQGTAPKTFLNGKVVCALHPITFDNSLVTHRGASPQGGGMQLMSAIALTGSQAAVQNPTDLIGRLIVRDRTFVHFQVFTNAVTGSLPDWYFALNPNDLGSIPSGMPGYSWCRPGSDLQTSFIAHILWSHVDTFAVVKIIMVWIILVQQRFSSQPAGTGAASGLFLDPDGRKPSLVLLEAPVSTQLFFFPIQNGSRGKGPL